MLLRGRSLLRRAALVLASALAALALFELGVRAGSELFFPRMMRFDDRLGWRHRPGVSKRFENESGERCLAVTNRYGNRGIAWPHERRSGTYRVLVLGDSFTEAVQVGEEDLFTARLEASESGLEVVNAGVAAYGTVQELLFLRDEGLSFRPDLVLVMFFQNDLADNVLPYALRIGPRPYAVLEGGRARIVESLDDAEFAPFCAPAPFRSFLYRHSYCFYAFNDRVYQPRRMLELTALDERNMERVDHRERVEVFRQVLERIRDLVASEGIDLALFLIPSREELAAGASAVHDEISECCARLGVACLRGLEPLRRAQAEGRRPYFPTDLHWTRDGHAVAAEEIARFLRARRSGR